MADSLAAVVLHVAEADHITIDGRFSLARTIPRPNYSIDAGLGKQVGRDLSRSFGQFRRTPLPWLRSNASRRIDPDDNTPRFERGGTRRI